MGGSTHNALPHEFLEAVRVCPTRQPLLDLRRLDDLAADHAVHAYHWNHRVALAGDVNVAVLAPPPLPKALMAAHHVFPGLRNSGRGVIGK